MNSIALVVARATNGVIGARGSIPWRLPEDLRHFRKLTIGKPCIMGRKTWESLPDKPLPGRLNIVVTRDVSFSASGAYVAHSLDAALARAKSESAEEIAVIGGAEVYRAALPSAHTIHLTELHTDFEGDTFFPAIDSERWCETAREEHTSPEGLRYAYVTLQRARQ